MQQSQRDQDKKTRPLSQFKLQDPQTNSLKSIENEFLPSPAQIQPLKETHRNSLDTHSIAQKPQHPPMPPIKQSPHQAVARLAQSVERETLNLKVVSLTPTSGSIPGGDDVEMHLPFFHGVSAGPHFSHRIRLLFLPP
ncbi:hypothetical protein B0T18DRAFT_414645 [Schizothecium vesticola]|uniref:Uncharacterized protein n=1 Tax=Schizothecium vesticola TaxID=314040 RepID=A0AA40EPP6_9PEZI|nr:hypothetical protein B0T18DRAFT_414645 [Schizothecium vesticola]